MATFIKAGFWETLCAKCTGYKGWLNLDKFVESKVPQPAYKVYTALLSQSGSSAPVATVLENTLGGTPTWARSTTGTYYFLLNDAFPIGQTVIFLNIVGDDSDGRYIAELNYAGAPNANQRGLVIKNATTNVNSDGISSLSSIEIRVYN
jgi:hypothetical protein